MPAPVAASLLAGSLIAVAAVGLVDAVYFLVARPPIFESRYARVLGLPNAAYGAIWYTVCLAAGTLLVATGELPLCLVLLIAAGATVLVSLFLVWALVSRLRTLCPFCFVGHACNAALFAILWFACAGQP